MYCKHVYTHLLMCILNMLLIKFTCNSTGWIPQKNWNDNSKVLILTHSTSALSFMLRIRASYWRKSQGKKPYSDGMFVWEVQPLGYLGLVITLEWNSPPGFDACYRRNRQLLATSVSDLYKVSTRTFKSIAARNNIQV